MSGSPSDSQPTVGIPHWSSHTIHILLIYRFDDPHVGEIPELHMNLAVLQLHVMDKRSEWTRPERQLTGSERRFAGYNLEEVTTTKTIMQLLESTKLPSKTAALLHLTYQSLSFFHHALV
jgi:hypothetical protein